MFTLANTVKPASFEYHRVQERDEVLALLRDLGDDARVLAGGQSLIPLMNFRLSQPAHLVALTGVEELRYVRVEGQELVVGAAARQADVEHDRTVNEHLPLLVDALRLVAHPPIRHRGTVCGSLAHADPAAELPAVALALGATLVACSATGERRVERGGLLSGRLHHRACAGRAARRSPLSAQSRRRSCDPRVRPNSWQLRPRRCRLLASTRRGADGPEMSRSWSSARVLDPARVDAAAGASRGRGRD